MIIGIIHKGSGLGDQLFSYIVTRVRAADLGIDFGFVGKEFFKGASFMNLDWGKEADLPYQVEEPTGKVVVVRPLYWGRGLFELNKPYYDPEFNFIPDGSVIDGYGAQDIRYFEHRLDEVREWLKVEHLFVHPNICVVNIRGGEFKAVPELFLPKSYWDEAMQMMTNKYPEIRFEIHMDDLKLAHDWFPNIVATKDISLNWRSIRYAKHLIISNSAFAILPALLNKNVKEVIAPKFWNRRNLGRWDWPMNYYKGWDYI